MQKLHLSPTVCTNTWVVFPFCLWYSESCHILKQTPVSSGVKTAVHSAFSSSGWSVGRHKGEWLQCVWLRLIKCWRGKHVKQHIVPEMGQRTGSSQRSQVLMSPSGNKNSKKNHFHHFLTILTLTILPWSETNAGYFPKQTFSGFHLLTSQPGINDSIIGNILEEILFSGMPSETKDNCAFPELHFGFKDVWEGLACSKLHVSYSMHYCHLGCMFSRCVFMCIILCVCVWACDVYNPVETQYLVAVGNDLVVERSVKAMFLKSCILIFIKRFFHRIVYSRAKLIYRLLVCPRKFQFSRDCGT